MQCFRNCLLNPLTLFWIIVGAAVGAIAGVLIASFLAFALSCLAVGGALVIFGVIVAGPTAGISTLSSPPQR